ncbi:MAG: PAQR family membrane homeostasis protein TrhA [Terracidiphilus sp.]
MEVTSLVPTAKMRLSVEELANTVTHGIGLGLSIAGFAVLLVLAIVRSGAWQIVSCAIYGVSLICVYASSTLYHCLLSQRMRRIFKVFDHCAIFLLIAGTYTPFLLVNLRGGWGWSLLGIVWGLAAAGIVLKVWFVDRYPILSTGVYLLMGWLALIAVKPLLELVPTVGLIWLLAGGLIYTFGVVFYGWKKIPYNHAIWHLFVMAGSACHYFAVVYSVIPRART